MRTFTAAIIAATALILAGTGSAAAESPSTGSTGSASGSGAVGATIVCSLVRVFVIDPSVECKRFPLPALS